VGHEDDAARFPVYGILKVFPSLMGDGDMTFLKEEKPVQIHVGEMMILIPRTPERIQPPFGWKEGFVESKAYGDSSGKDEKIARGNKPGHDPEYPEA
jgi:hypothetical protein